MPDPSLVPSYRPIEPSSNGARRLRNAFAVLAMVAAGVLILRPETAAEIWPGWPGSMSSLQAGAMVALCVILVLAGFQSQREQTRARRALFEHFAASVGGQVSQQPYRATADGWEGGLQAQYRVSNVPVLLMRVGGKSSNASVRLAAEIALRRDFQFQIFPGSRAARIILSKTVLLPVFSLVGRRTDLPAGQAVAAVERMRFLAEDPVTTGDPIFDSNFLVKASDPALGRDLAAEASVRAALEALRGHGHQFRVALEQGLPSGPGRLLVELSSFPAGIEGFGAMDAALRAALGCLRKLGIQDERANSAA